MPYILQSAGIYEIYSILLGNGAGGAVNFIATVLVLFYVGLVYLNKKREKEKRDDSYLKKKD